MPEKFFEWIEDEWEVSAGNHRLKDGIAAEDSEIHAAEQVNSVHIDFSFRYGSGSFYLSQWFPHDSHSFPDKYFIHDKNETITRLIISSSAFVLVLARFSSEPL